LAVFMLAINAQRDFNPDLATGYGYLKVLCWMAAFACITVLWRKGLERDRMLSVGIPGLFVVASLSLSLATFLGNSPSLANLIAVLSEIRQAFSPDQYGLP